MSIGISALKTKKKIGQDNKWAKRGKWRAKGFEGILGWTTFLTTGRTDFLKPMCPDSGSICRDSLPLRIHSCGQVLSSLFRGLFGVEQDPAELAGNGVVLLFLFLFAIIWKSSLEEGGLSAAEWQSRKHVWEWKLNLKIKMLLELRNASRRCRCRGILELWKEGRLLSSSSDTLRKVPCFPSDPLPALSF